MSKNDPKNEVTIGLIQTHTGENIDENIALTIIKVKEAITKGAKIICLQELYNSLYFPQYEHVPFEKYAETIPGKSTEVFSKLAKEHEIIIIVPLFEKTADGKYYNTAVVINTDGKLLESYRKTHIPHDPLFYEKNYFAEGNSGYKLYKTKYGNFAVLICYDQWYPEAARIATNAGADLIFYPSAIGNVENYTPPEGDWHEAWEIMQRSHAIANGTYVASIDRVGKENELLFWGQSFVADPFGQVLKRASATEDEALVVTIDLSKTKNIRNDWGFLRNRRPETYHPLTKNE